MHEGHRERRGSPLPSDARSRLHQAVIAKDVVGDLGYCHMAPVHNEGQPNQLSSFVSADRQPSTAVS